MYKILIIEDDMTIAETLASHLTRWGYEVKYVEDFKNILEETAACSPHLILLDIMLPFFNGLSAPENPGIFQSADHLPVIGI